MAKKNTEEAEQEAAKQKYIDELKAIIQYSISKFDDQILYISSGALGLSLGFIKDIVPLGSAAYRWVLVTSWWVLAATIIISLVSHLVSYYLTQNQIQKIENKKPLKDDKVTPILNIITVFLLILGILTQVIFVSLNTDNMAKDNASSKANSSQGQPNKVGSIPLGMPVSSPPKTIRPDTTSTTNSGNKNK